MCWQTSYVGICGCRAISSNCCGIQQRNENKSLRQILAREGFSTVHLSACDLPLSIAMNASPGAETMQRRPQECELKREERGDVRSGEVSTKGCLTEPNKQVGQPDFQLGGTALSSLSNSRK